MLCIIQKNSSNYKLLKISSNKNIKPDDVIKIVQQKVDNILKDNTIMDKIFSEENNREGKYMKYGRDILIFLPTVAKCKTLKSLLMIIIIKDL